MCIFGHCGSFNTLKDGNNMGVINANPNIQILMNVRLVMTTVIKSVPTLKAPSPVPVTVDIH